MRRADRPDGPAEQSLGWRRRLTPGRCWPPVVALLIGLIVGAVMPAAALPPRAGLCSGLTGDELTRCLYSDLDSRLRVLEGATSPPTASPTSPTSPTTSPTTSASPSSTPSATTTTRPAAPGGWLSGASGSEAANGSLGTWRGAPMEIVGVWIDDPAIYPFGPRIPGCGGCGEFATWTGPADVGIAPPTWKGWNREASGGSDAFWRATAQNLRKYRAGKGTTYVRPYYEFNGDWFPHSVRRGEEATFIRAWERVAGIFRSEFPEAKMMLGTAASGYGQRIAVADAYPQGVDVLSIDFYNEWPWCRTQGCFDAKIENGGGANSLEDLRRLAQSKGDPVLISEWGNAGRSRPAGSGGGGDAPAFMTAWHGWLSRHAGSGPGQVLGEVYFNIGGYDARFELYVQGSASTVQPETAARYRSLFSTS